MRAIVLISSRMASHVVSNSNPVRPNAPVGGLGSVAEEDVSVPDECCPVGVGVVGDTAGRCECGKEENCGVLHVVHHVVL